jgi:hypothetical protein
MDRNEERAIEWECQQILTRFCLYSDTRQYEKLVNLFTPDGVWHRLGEALAGHEMLRTAMEARPLDAMSRHVITNVLVTVIDADHAESISYKSIYRNEEGELLEKPVPLNGPKWVSVYADSFLRTDEGWRITRKEGTTLFEREPVP